MIESPDEQTNTFDFTCEYSSNLPELLSALNISIAFTSYQAGRLMVVRSDEKSIDVNYKNFPRPMGLCSTESGLTLGTFAQIINFHRADNLIDQLKAPLPSIQDDITAPRIHPREQEGDDSAGAPKVMSELDSEQEERHSEQLRLQQERQQQLHAAADSRVDSCFITRSSHYTGMINLHDIDWGDEGLWVVNSSFSCLCTLDPDYSFVPRWKPHFITALVPEDRCHLNGMTLKDGKPAYVTTFSTFDEPGKWRKGDKFNGTLMSVDGNEILIRDLVMPHSPRFYQDSVYYCNSGLGLFCKYNPRTGDEEIIAELQGFTRGVDFYGSLAFVGLSKVRAGNVLHAPPLTTKYDETFSGIWLIDLNTNSTVGYIKFTGNVDQIYDIAVIPNCKFPEIIEPSHPRMRNHFCIPA